MQKLICLNSSAESGNPPSGPGVAAAPLRSCHPPLRAAVRRCRGRGPCGLRR